MLLTLILSGSLAVGQSPAPAEAATPPPPAPALPDRWFLMQELQGTYPGWCLDGNRTTVSGWGR